MKKIISTALLALVGLVAVGLLSLQTVTTTQAAPADDTVSKRDDDTPDLVLVADDDDDDTNDGTAGSHTNTRSRNTGVSRSTNDNTNSRFTAVSRDRDLSRSDKTRDWTRDGNGKVKRDWSANRTNDRSRNDTRR
jgi:hypothetical protein